MKTKLNFLTIVLLGSIALTSCKKKGCTDPTADNYSVEAKKDDGTCEYTPAAQVTLNFTQNFGGTAVSASNFDNLLYTNAHGEVLSITKMQYLISDVQLFKTTGDTVHIDGYHFIDMTDASSFTYVLPIAIDAESYSGIGFTYGFDEVDNVDGAYADLNLASWSSPMMLGGGYHQMKFEGRYINSSTDTVSFQYHNLSTTREITATDTIFHANHVDIKLPNAFTISSNTTIEIKMDIKQWFESPNLWDLNTVYTMLMPNYSAQVKMSQNASTVFSVGAITE